MSDLLTLAEALNDAEVFTDGDWVESKDQDPQGDVRLVQLADVGDGCWIDKSERFLTSRKATELRCTFLKAGCACGTDARPVRKMLHISRRCDALCHGSGRLRYPPEP